MGPEKWKGELPIKEAVGAEEGERADEREGAGQPGAARSAADVADDDPREEEGWFQPESSAQKGVESLGD